MAYQGQQGDGRCVDVRRERHAKCDAIPRIPSAAGAHSVEEHSGTDVDPLSEPGSVVIATVPGLLKGNQGECSWDYPTLEIGHLRGVNPVGARSEEHTSELQSPM